MTNRCPRADMQIPADHPPQKKPKIGVLMVNLGTPDGTDYWSIRRYLSEFLSDPRVIEIPKLVWQPLLQGIILTVRPKKTGAAYDKIWFKDTDESPLRRYTREQSEKLAQRFPDAEIVVDWAMRYGQPSIASKMNSLKEQGCQRILVMALYPQYCAATMATVYDCTFAALKKMRWQPAIRTMPAYHDHPKYIEVLSQSIKNHVDLDLGDPYHCHCVKNTRLVREHLGWDEEYLQMSFQSRFGKAEWLQPYTEATLIKLAESGVKKVMIAAPAFVSDCVETLEELAIEGREVFLEAGGEEFELIPCLNSSEPAIDLFQTLAEEELSGWI